MVTVGCEIVQGSHPPPPIHSEVQRFSMPSPRCNKSSKVSSDTLVLLWDCIHKTTPVLLSISREMRSSASRAVNGKALTGKGALPRTIGYLSLTYHKPQEKKWILPSIIEFCSN